jgi:hypothetical protein
MGHEPSYDKSQLGLETLRSQGTQRFLKNGLDVSASIHSWWWKEIFFSGLYCASHDKPWFLLNEWRDRAME